MSDLHRQRDRATSFGSIAQLYDDIRPTYPDALVHDLLARDPHDVLDVGCGTGRAAVLFAARGREVLGVEPDPGMADVARRHGIEVEVSGFEDWDDAGRRFDLLISGQAWHWVEPLAGARKALSVLRPGGVAALFWNMDSLAGSDRGALDEVYRREAPALESRYRRYGGGTGPRDEVTDALTATGFTEVAKGDYRWQRHYEPDQYLQLVQTFSDHTLLPDGQRARLLDALREVLTGLGGLDVTYDCRLVSALAP